MGILLGSSTTLNRHPLLQFGCSPFSPSPRGSILPCAHRKVAKKKRSLAMACVQGLGSTWNEGSESQRRRLVLVGISVLPLLKNRAVAAESPLEDIPAFALKEIEHPGRAENPQSSISEPLTGEPPVNVFLSLLNVIGILGSGVLGALYAISKEDKAAMESTVQSMKLLLDAKQAAITSSEKRFELRMLREREERQKQVKKLREEEAALSKNLASANSTISTLSQELRTEKRLLGELQMKLDQLHRCLLQADKEKRVLVGKINEKTGAIVDLQDRLSLLSLEIKDKEMSMEVLKSCLTDKESEAMTLKSVIEQTKVECRNADSAAGLLKIEVRKIREDLNLKNSKIDELSAKIELLVKERDDNRQKFEDLQREYNHFKSASAAKADLDSKLLSKKDDELQMLEERLAFTIADARKSHDLLEKIMGERDGVRAMMEEERLNVKKLQQELEFTRESLEASKFEVSDLSKQLMESERGHERLEMEISRVRSESSEAEILMRQGLDEARSASGLLSEELVSVKGILHETNEALEGTTEELKNALEDQAALKRELLDIYKKAEITGRELKEARSMMASLEIELETSFKQLKSGNEAREALTSNLKEVTQALDEMNRTTNSLSRELERAQSRTVNLEMENQVLSKALSDQKRVTLEARDNIEDAQNLLHRLGDEREDLEKKGTRLEEELAMAKGEILRMRRKDGLRRASPSEEAKDPNEAGAMVSSMKRGGGGIGGKRRKRRTPSPSSEDSK